MKIIYQTPFEELKVPKSESSDSWDIYVSKLGSAFIFVKDIWFILFDVNLRNDISSDILDLISRNKGLYSEIIDDLKFLDIKRFKEIENDIFFKSFQKNIKSILDYYEQRTISPIN